MVIIIISILYNFFEKIINYKFLECFLTKKKFKRTTLWITIILMVVINFCVNEFCANIILNLFISIAIILALCFFFDDKIGRKILLAAIYIVFSILAETSAAYLIDHLFKLDTTIVGTQDAYTNIAMALNLLIKYIIITVVKKYVNKQQGLLNNIVYLQLAVVSILSIDLFSVFMKRQIESGEIDYLFGYFMCLILLIINIFLYVTYERLEKMYQKNLEDSVMAQNYKYRENYYSSMEKHQKEIRRIRHDLKNQLIALQGNVKSENTVKEINNIIEEIQTNEETCFTRNPGINAILYEKYMECQQKDIKVNFNVNISELINVSYRDIGTILGNGLDNAIEACEKCVDREKLIELKILQFNKSIVINIRNTAPENKSVWKTTKDDMINHGYGLKSIKNSVKKYKGTCDYYIEDYIFNLEINIWNS